MDADVCYMLMYVDVCYCYMLMYVDVCEDFPLFQYTRTAQVKKMIFFTLFRLGAQSEVPLPSMMAASWGPTTQRILIRRSTRRSRTAVAGDGIAGWSWMVYFTS